MSGSSICRLVLWLKAEGGAGSPDRVDRTAPMAGDLADVSLLVSCAALSLISSASCPNGNTHRSCALVYFVSHSMKHVKFLTSALQFTLHCPNADIGGV